MKHVIVSGLDTVYQDEGSGKILLLVHGWGSSMKAFDELAVKLAAGFRVIRLDLPGFGGTQTPQESWSLDDYISYLEEFLRKVGVADLHGLVGHSLGGRIAIRAQATGHLTSDKLVLLASHGIASPNSLRNMVYRVISKGAKLLLTPLPNKAKQQLRKRWYGSLGSTDYLQVNEAMKQTFQQIIRQDLRNDATKVTTDTLLVYGTADKETPLAFGKLFASRMPHARLEVIDGAGHYVFQDALTKVTKLMEAFL